MNILLENAQVVNSDSISLGHVWIRGDKIHLVIPDGENIPSEDDIDIKVDCGGTFILPGIIDPHVHLRDLEQDYKETIETGTQAAIKNGITSVFAMSNTIPRLSTKKAIIEYQKRIDNGTYSNVGIFGNLSEGFMLSTLDEMRELGIFGLKIFPGDTSPSFPLNWEPMLEAEKIFRGTYSEDNIDPGEIFSLFNEFLVEEYGKSRFKKDFENWIQLFVACAERGISLIFHPDIPIEKEDRVSLFKEKVQCGKSLLQAHAETYSKLHELLFVIMIFRIFQFVLEDNVEFLEEKIDHLFPSIEFCHVSCPESVELIDYLISEFPEKLHVSIEVTPHHLFLSYEDSYEVETFAKVLQPLRSKQDNKRLQSLLSLGKISYIGTDHAPHTLEEKSMDFLETASGFPSLDFYPRFVLSKVFNGFMDLQKFVEKTSTNVANFLQLDKKGRIERGYDADFFVIKQSNPYEILPKNFCSKSKLTPYPLSEIIVDIEQVWLGGKLIATKYDQLIEDNPQLATFIGKKEGILLRKEYK